MPEQLRSTEVSAMASQAATPAPFECRVSSGSDELSAWVHVAGEIDLATAPGLEFVLRRAAHDAQLVVLVLFDVTFMDSNGLHIIVDAWLRAHPPERRLVVIVSSGSQVHRILQLTGLNERLDLIDYPAASGAAERLHAGGSPN
jgi:anti-anti-sigma factor